MQHGANPGCPDAPEKHKVLRRLSNAPHFDCTAVMAGMLEAGADPTEVDRDGRMVFEKLCERNDPKRKVRQKFILHASFSHELISRIDSALVGSGPVKLRAFLIIFNPQIDISHAEALFSSPETKPKDKIKQLAVIGVLRFSPGVIEPAAYAQLMQKIHHSKTYAAQLARLTVYLSDPSTHHSRHASAQTCLVNMLENFNDDAHLEELYNKQFPMKGPACHFRVEEAGGAGTSSDSDAMEEKESKTPDITLGIGQMERDRLLRHCESLKLTPATLLSAAPEAGLTLG